MSDAAIRAFSAHSSAADAAPIGADLPRFAAECDAHRLAASLRAVGGLLRHYDPQGEPPNAAELGELMMVLGTHASALERAVGTLKA